MKSKRMFTLILIVVFSPILTTAAYANSSWHWLTDEVSVSILPYVVVMTLLIEFGVLKFVNSIKPTLKLFAIVCLANVASFLLPYAALLLPSDVGYNFEKSINHLPIYTVGLCYLLLTLAAEVPILYNAFKNTAASRKRLLISIAAVNTITTIIVAAVERTLFKGIWY